jgi:Flp pilus assembly pilin Flp
MYAYLYLRNLLNSIKKGEEGQDLIEYALIVVVLVVVAVGGMALVGDEISGLWGTITTWLGTAPEVGSITD